MSAPSIDERYKAKYRIYREGVNSFQIQRKVLWFWLDWTEYGFWSEDEARKCLEAWKANELVRGEVIPL